MLLMTIPSDHSWLRELTDQRHHYNPRHGPFVNLLYSLSPLSHHCILALGLDRPLAGAQRVLRASQPGEALGAALADILAL